MTKYLIVFLDKHGRGVGDTITHQLSRDDACDFGWHIAPEGTDDFMVHSEEEYIQLTGDMRGLSGQLAV